MPAIAPGLKLDDCFALLLLVKPGVAVTIRNVGVDVVKEAFVEVYATIPWPSL
jgi:hypothetical protein